MKKKLSLLLATVLSCSMLFAGCGSSNTASSDSSADGADAGLKKVSVAFCTFTGYAPMFIAKEKGFFEENGIDIDIQIIEDESTYASLITKGDIQFLATAQDPNVRMFGNGATMKYVLTMDKSVGADGLVATADIKSLDDLKGKSLALDKSASSYYFFLKALGDSNIQESDIEVIDMGDTTEAGVAFMGGQVDAAIMWEPELSEALDSVEGAHAVVTSKDYPDCIQDSLVVNSDYAAENPDVVEGMQKAWNQAVAFYNENAEESYELMAGGFDEVTAEDVAGDCEGLFFLGEEENNALVNADNDENIYAICQDMADFWQAQGECESTELDDYFTLVK